MSSNRNWLPLSLLSLALLAGCASQRPVPVIAPCLEIPPLPTAIAAPAEFPTALSKLNGWLTRRGLPPLVIQPGSPPANSPTSESDEPAEIDGLPVLEPDLRRPRAPDPWHGMNERRHTAGRTEKPQERGAQQTP